MSTTVGVALVSVILVGLPLGAIWLAGRWRDPPRERWGVPQRDRERAAGTLEVAEFRIRKDFRITDERRWAAVRRAVTRGEAAPEDLRPAAVRYARATVEAIDQEVSSRWGRRPTRRWLTVLLAAVAVAGIAFVLVANPLLGVAYVLYWTALLLSRSRWALTRRRFRAQAAVAANT